MITDKSAANIYLWVDLINLFLTFSLSLYFFQDRNIQIIEGIFLLCIALLWTFVCYSRKMYLWHWKKGLISRFFIFTQTYFIWAILVSLAYFIFSLPIGFMNILIVSLIGFLLLGFTTKFFTDIVINLINKKTNKFRLVADAENQKDFINHLMDNNDDNDRFLGIIKWKEDGDNEVAVVEEEKLSGKISDMNQYLHEKRIDEIVISIPLETSRKVKRIMEIADYHGVRVKYVLDFKQTFGRTCKMIKYGELEALNVRQLPLDEPYASFLKNSFDFIFSFVVLLGLMPIFIVLGILIKIDSPGTIFYCPTRIGKGGKPIKIFKFRTMIKNDVPTGGHFSTQKDDPRISKLGKILRKYSLDELPQFINVFLGEMSVVGPRPHRSYLNQQFQACEANYMIRHYYKPGITGWAQVNGWRGPTDTNEQKHQRTLHDLWYLENWSLRLDIKIIFMTLIGKKTHKDTF